MTRVALLTPPGRGGIALLEIAGGEGIPAGETLAKVFKRPLPGLGALALGALADERGPIDEVLVARVAEDRFEIGCHGGPAVTRRALAALEAAGAHVTDAGAMAGPQPGAIRAEARTLLPLAETDLAAKVLLAGLSGALEAELDALPLEEPVLERLVDSSRLGIACWRPPRVALVGAPNAGKSTLFNALLGRDRAIVSPEPGTTRDALEERCSLGGVPVTLVDLAGLRESEDAIEQAGVARAGERAREADLRLVVVDASQPWVTPFLGPRTVLVLNKRDLLDAEARAHVRHRIAREVPAGLAVIEVSAKTGTGLEGVKAAIVGELAGSAGEGGGPVLFTERQRDHAERALEALRAGSPGEARARLGAIKAATA